MNILNKTLMTLSFLAPLAASAGVAEDIALIRPLLPAGTDVAQVQVQLLQGSNTNDALEAGKSNYVITDINRDGVKDILVIAEEQPRFQNLNTEEPCSSTQEENCHLVYGRRALLFYVGQANGGFRHVFTNNKMILAADEGGVMGDPLQGLALQKNGSITYSVYGGSSWRWSYTDTMQFRGGDLYIVGQDSYQGWTGDLRSETKSVNLVTGQVIETKQKNADAPVRTKRYRIPVKPLVKVADDAGQEH